MSIGLRADSGGTSGAVTINGSDKLVITSAGNITATTFTGALAGNASTATALSTTTGAAPVYGVRAWVNFDGTRNTSGVADATNTNRFIYGNGIASGNVTSVLRNGLGDYTVYFSTAMPDINFSVVAINSTLNTSGQGYMNPCEVYASRATNAVRITTSIYNASYFLDVISLNVIVVM